MPAGSRDITGNALFAVRILQLGEQHRMHNETRVSLRAEANLADRDPVRRRFGASFAIHFLGVTAINNVIAPDVAHVLRLSDLGQSPTPEWKHKAKGDAVQEPLRFLA